MAQLEQGLSALAEKFAMTWRMTRAADRKRMAIFVSRSDHALRELRWRVESGELNADITMVISNHRATAELVTSWGIPFRIPISADTRAEAEAAQLKLLDGEVDFVVLARYMKHPLRRAFLAACPHPIINIHHSFLLRSPAAIRTRRPPTAA